jgi:hypothetical protein
VSEETPKPEATVGANANEAAPHDLDGAQARLAYSIIQTLLTHTRVTGDLVALMAQVIEKDTLEALTNTPHWAAYLDSRRTLERAREELEQFTEIMTRLGGEDS